MTHAWTKHSQKPKHTQDNKSQDSKSQDNKSHHTHITKGHDTRVEKKIQKLTYRDFMQEGQLANILKK
jgi:hypothetical protein